jgi:hypothetical protein
VFTSWFPNGVLSSAFEGTTGDWATSALFEKINKIDKIRISDILLIILSGYLMESAIPQS